MKILDRYLISSLIKSTFLALLVLVAIFAFFSLIDQLEESGQGRYGIAQVLEYVILTVPNLMSELFPIAAVIGSMMTLGTMSSLNELAVIRTSGISQKALIVSLSKGALILIAIAFLIGEIIAPYTEQRATQKKSMALTEQITLKTKYGFWSRNGNNFINIRKILPGNQVEDIYIYEFDDNNHLRSSAYAKRAKYIDDHWQLEDVKQSEISEDRVISRPIDLANWKSVLNPDVINLVLVEPQHLSLWELQDYVAYLKENEQNSQVYEQAFWFKIAKPFTILLMVIIAVPVVKVYSRQNNVGQRVFIGCLLGILFYMFNQICGHLGVAYNLHPALSMFFPLLILFTAVVVLMNQQAIVRRFS